MFRIGDLVVHPMHGAGVIDSIVKERVAGVTKEYYVFKMPMGGLLLKIPVANSKAIGVRHIISAEEAEALAHHQSRSNSVHEAKNSKKELSAAKTTPSEQPQKKRPQRTFSTV